MTSNHSNIDSFSGNASLLLLSAGKDEPLAVEMLTVEREYFVNDELEYRPEDWLPSSVIMAEPIPSDSGYYDWLELPMTDDDFLDAFLTQSPLSPLFMSDSAYSTDSLGQLPPPPTPVLAESSSRSLVQWSDGMPMLHPVSRQEYCNLPRSPTHGQHSSPKAGDFLSSDDIVPLLADIDTECPALESLEHIGIAWDHCFHTPYLPPTSNVGTTTNSHERRSILGAAAAQNASTTFSSLGSALLDWTPLQSTAASSTTKSNFASTGTFSSLTSNTRSSGTYSSFTSKTASSIMTTFSSIRNSTTCSNSIRNTGSTKRLHTPLSSVANTKKSSFRKGKKLFASSIRVKTKPDRDMSLDKSASSGISNFSKPTRRPAQSVGATLDANLCCNTNNPTQGAQHSSASVPHVRFSFCDDQPRSCVHHNKPVSSIWVRRSTRRLVLDPDALENHPPMSA